MSRRGRCSKIGLLELNRPDTFNALCPWLVEELASAVEQLDSDPSIRCLIITGNERFFSGKLRKYIQAWNCLQTTLGTFY